MSRPTEETLQRIRAALSQNPWPEIVFPMTEGEYVEAVPDKRLRSGISGLLCRLGGRLAREDVERAIRGE